MTDTTTDGMQVGDELVLQEDYGRRESVVRVLRRTATQILVKRGTRERRFLVTGNEVGSRGFDVARVFVASAERLAQVRDKSRRRYLIAAIQDAKLDTLTTEQLEAVASALLPP